MARRKPFSDQVRDAIKHSGTSCYEISQRTGIDKGTLSRFINRKQGLSMANLDLVTKLLRLDLVKREGVQ